MRNNLIKSMLILSISFNANAELTHNLLEHQLEHQLAQGEKVMNAITLANVAICEASTDGRAGMLAVMDVVLNRVKNKRFPNTINEVVNQKYQFECITNGKNHSFGEWGFKQAYDLAINKLDGKEPKMTIATHYYAPKSMPSNKPPFWANKKFYLGAIGSHKFFKLN